ncbi:PspC domain-containing protein [Bacillus salitolerans]|uniref:PspC domain-containing protein n=1 Tax=Bacillus salitolerans TaxID=1437434 RepID=A0ABW4LW40_9BACI
MNKLFRSRSNRQIAGVIGGLASYTGVDASLLRVIFVICLLMSFGTFALIYFVWMLIVPNEEDVIR